VRLDGGAALVAGYAAKEPHAMMNNIVERLVFGLGVVAVLAVFGLATYQFMNNPVEARYADSGSGVELVPRDAAAHAPAPEDSETNYHAMLTQGQRSRLWYPLVSPPPPRPSPPDWSKMFQNVTFTMNAIGTGDERQIQVLTGRGNQQSIKWIKKGDFLNGARVREIGETAIVFEANRGGQEFTHRERLIQ
jgi:hypothetical protein